MIWTRIIAAIFLLSASIHLFAGQMQLFILCMICVILLFILSTLEELVKKL